MTERRQIRVLVSGRGRTAVAHSIAEHLSAAGAAVQIMDDELHAFEAPDLLSAADMDVQISTQQIARGAEYEYTFDCHLGQGGANFGAVAKLHSDLAAEFSGQTRPTFAEYGFRRRVAVLRCLRSLTAEEVGRLRSIFDDFNMRSEA